MSRPRGLSVPVDMKCNTSLISQRSMFCVSVQNKFVNVFFLFPVKGKKTFSLSVEGLPSKVMDSLFLYLITSSVEAVLIQWLLLDYVEFIRMIQASLGNQFIFNKSIIWMIITCCMTQNEYTTK